MEKERLITEREIAELIHASNNLKPGEIQVGAVTEAKISHTDDFKIKAQFSKKDIVSHDDKIIPFSAIVGKSEDKIQGEINEDIFKKTKKKKVTRGFFSRMKDYIKDLAQKEEDLDYYVDEHNRPYIIENDIRTYLDGRGFNYYLKYVEGRTFAFTKLEDGTIGTFMDPDRTIIEVNGHLYPMDINGTINYDEELDYPRNR